MHCARASRRCWKRSGAAGGVRREHEDGDGVERSADADELDGDAEHDGKHPDDADADELDSSTNTATGTTTTRSAPEPAFTQGEAKAEGTSGAAAVVRAHGYTPNDTSQYHSDQTLRVLVGTRTGSADGYAQQAFFFVSGRYMGTDTKLPSATIKVIGQADTEVTLGYALYRKGDALVTPSGGEAT